MEGTLKWPQNSLEVFYFDRRRTPLIYPPTPFVPQNRAPRDFIGKYFPIKDLGDIKSIHPPTTKSIRGNRQRALNW
jgi:hypothetical protein